MRVDDVARPLVSASAAAPAAASAAAVANVSAALEHLRSAAAASSGPIRLRRVAALSVSRSVRYMNRRAARLRGIPRAGPGGYCPARHPMYYEASFLESNGIL